MSKTPAQVTAVGIFVFSALILAVSMLIAFGGHGINKQTVDYKLYFYSRVKGLSAGSNVMFRGVRVGQVRNVTLYERNEEDDFMPRGEVDLHEFYGNGDARYPIEVDIELDPACLGFEVPWWQSFVPEFNDTLTAEIRQRLQKIIIEDGLTAQLQTASMLTGQLYIDFVFSPHKPNQEERAELERELKYDVFPTRLAAMDKFARQLGEKNIDNAIENLSRLALQFNQFVESGKSQEMLDNVTATVENVRAVSANLKKATDAAVVLMAGGQNLIASLNQETTQSAEQLRATLQRASQTLDNLDKVVRDMHGELTPVVGSLNGLMAQAHTDLVQAQTLLDNLNNCTAQNSPERQQLMETLKQCSRAAAEAREAIERINADPQRFLLGPQGGDK